jgi:hypothetical protein
VNGDHDAFPASSTALFLKGRILAFVDNDDFDLFGLADRKDKLRAEAQEPILVRDNKTPNFTP